MKQYVGTIFETNASQKGILWTFLDGIEYKCSSSHKGECDNIFNSRTELNTSNFWSSKGEDAFFEVTLKRGFIHPRDIGIYSCNELGCIYNISVFGIEEGRSELTEICYYEGQPDDFKGKFDTFPCIDKSNKAYKTIRLQQRGVNDAQIYEMNLYLIDIYGFVSFGYCISHQDHSFNIRFMGYTCIMIVLTHKIF